MVGDLVFFMLYHVRVSKRLEKNKVGKLFSIIKELDNVIVDGVHSLI